MNRRFFSCKEVAAMLNLHVQTVYKLFWSGKLPGGRIGRSVKIDWLAVEKKLKEQ
jgi:excisionase family DNA binding protein